MLENIWNPWHGCKKYSEGCKYCYMYFLDARYDKDGSNIYRVKNSFDLPLKKTRSGEYKIPPGSTVHVCMTSDFFLEEADEWRNDAWDIIKKRPDLHFWLQTKRADRVEKCLPDNWGDGWENVSMCFSCENQKRADERVPILLDLPFREKHIMCAPMIGEVTLDKYLASGQIKSVLADGENYDGDRVLDYDWIRALYGECLRYGVKFRFVGTGNFFRKDGKVYHIFKAYQHVQALRSGCQIPPVDTNIPMQPRCRTCKRRDTCNGCKYCGKCGDKFKR